MAHDGSDDRSNRFAGSIDDDRAALVSAEEARQRLAQVQQELASLRMTLERLVQVSEASRPLSDRLSDLALDAAREVLRAGGGARASLPALSQLMEMRHQTVSAFRHLESYARQAAVIVQNAADQVTDASARLDRVVPVLRERVSRPSDEKKVVALELKLSNEKKEPQQERTIFDVWPEAARPRDIGDN